MPAMNMNEPQQQVQQALQQMQGQMPAPQQPMPEPGPVMENPPFGISGGGPHGPPGQPSLAEMMSQHGFPGMTSPYMRWK